MGQKEKLIKRLKSRPKDFTFAELETLLAYLGFERSNKGHTSGSRVMFRHNEKGIPIAIHKPHSRNELLIAQVKQIVSVLEKEELLNE